MLLSPNVAQKYQRCPSYPFHSHRIPALVLVFFQASLGGGTAYVEVKVLQAVLHVEPMKVYTRGRQSELWKLELDTKLGYEVAAFTAHFAFLLRGKAVDDGRRILKLILAEEPLRISWLNGMCHRGAM